MAGNKKRLSRRAQERLNRQLRAFDLTMLGIGITTVAAGFVCAFGNTALGGANAAGFAFWYLIVQSYLPLGLLSGIKALFGLAPFAPGANEANFLVAVDLVWFLVLWAVLRMLGKRNGKSALLHISTRLAAVLLWWGWFQLLCAVVVAGWNHGGLASYHRRLAAPAEIRAEAAEKNAPASPAPGGAKKP